MHCITLNGVSLSGSIVTLTIRFCDSLQSGKWLHYGRVPHHYGCALQRQVATLCKFNTMQVQHCSSSTLSKLNTLCKKIHDSSVIGAPLCLNCPIIQCIYCTALDRIVTHVQHFITVYCGVSLGLMFGPTCNTMHNATVQVQHYASSTLCALCIVVFRWA